MDKMQLFCRHIRAALACYEDMPPEGQSRARLYVTRKAGAIRNLKAVSDAPGGELAGELLQKMQRLDDYKLKSNYFQKKSNLFCDIY